MQISAWTLALALTPALRASAYMPESTNATDLLATEALSNLIASVGNGSLARELASHNVSQTCDISQAGVRREYSTLSNEKKLEYTNAGMHVLPFPFPNYPGC